MYSRGLPPEADTVITLRRIAGIIALVFGIPLIIFGVITLIVLVGIVLIALGVIDVLIFVNCIEIVRLVEAGEYAKAKEKSLVWMIIGLLFSLIPGTLLLVAYMKYDDLDLLRYGRTIPPSPI